MRVRLPRLLPVLTGWPRRAAAALCFAFALLTSLSPASSHAPREDTAAPAGLSTAAATVYADAVSFVRPGQRIDLVETVDAISSEPTPPPPTVVARDVRVLAIRPSSESSIGAPTAQLLVAASRDVAVAIAAHQGAQVLAAISAPP
jgi:hypothetical protein